METETTTWSKFSNGGKTVIKQILALEEINKSNRAGLWESESGIQVGSRSKSSLGYQFHQNRLAS